MGKDKDCLRGNTTREDPEVVPDGGVESKKLLTEDTDLRETQEIYTKIAEETRDGIAIVQEEEIVYVNESLTDMLSEAEEAVLGSPFYRWFVDEDLVKKRYEERIEGEKPPGQYEVKIETRQGEVRDVEVSVNRISYEGKPAVLATFRDITKRKEKEKELKRHESIVKNSTDIISQLDENGDIIYHNPSIKQVLGYKQEDWVGENIFDYIHPEDVERVRGRFESLLGDPENNTEQAEYRIRHKDGSYVWIESRGRDKRDSEIGGVIVNSRDITGRKKREQKLREIKERLDLAVEAGNIGIWDWDITSDEITINQEWKETFGAFEESNKVTPDEWSEKIHPDDSNKEAIEKHLRGETDYYDIEFRLQTGDNEWTWVRSIGEVIERDEDGEPERAVGVSIDIDDRKRDEKLLEKQNEYLRRIKEASQDMIAAESRGEVAEILVGVSEELFESASFYSWENGVLRNKRETITSEDNDPAWRAFTHRDTVLTEIDGEDTESYSREEMELCIRDEGGTEGPVRLDTPIGEKGVLCVRLPATCDSVGSFIDSLVAAAETSLEKVKKEEGLRKVAEEVQEKNEELTRLSEIDEVVRQLIKKVIESDSRETIQRTVCEQLLEVEDWEYTWFVEKDEEGVSPTCCYGDKRFTEMLMESIEDSPTIKSLEDGEERITDDVATSDVSEWRRTVLNEGYLSVATIPIEHGGRSFGVLEVYSSETGSFGGGYSQALEDAAKVAGYAFTAAEQVSSILSGGFSRLMLRIDDSEVDCIFSNLVEELDTEFHINAVVPGPEGTIVYFKTDAEYDEIREVANEMGVDISKTMNGYSATVTDMSVVDRAMDLGGRVSKYSQDKNGFLIDVDLPQGADARALVDVVSEDYPSVELVAKKASDEPDYTESPLDSLTERQKTVMRLAYESGFFKTPREKTGQELAEDMGITATTFHQHLRSAEEKLVNAVFNEPN